MSHSSSIDRRSFLRNTALASMSFSAAWSALSSKAEAGQAVEGVGYGALFPVNDNATGLPLLMLPEGFTYTSFSWTGDLMANGRPTPAAHDGMAAFPTYRGFCRLVRNHEIGQAAAPFAPEIAYDTRGGGGTTTIDFDMRRGAFVRAVPSISGTHTNCAGGLTPWMSWLTCEETTAQGGVLTKPHGYIFEVPVLGTTTAQPLTAMGRFAHEAVAVDPSTGIVYETEDSGDNSGFYRFVPTVPGQLAQGGVLQMLGIKDVPRFDLRTNQTRGLKLKVEWHTIGNPNALSGATVYTQGRTLGGAQFRRLEGAWWGNGAIYFVSTNGGNVGQGQVWAYDPAADEVWLVYESPNSAVLNAPDNICVSPRGGLVLCEDGGGTEYLHGLTDDGEIFQFCQNNVDLRGVAHGKNVASSDFRDSEFAGACYSPDGQWLFCNIQTPGITFAITGPWGRGAL